MEWCHLASQYSMKMKNGLKVALDCFEVTPLYVCKIGGVSWFINGSTSHPGFAEIQKWSKLYLQSKKWIKTRNGEELDIRASQGAAVTLILITIACDG